MLKLFALFEWRRRQRHEAFEACATIRVNADVMVKRAIARRRRRAREIERTETVVRDRRADDLDDVRVRALFGFADDGREGRDVDFGIGKRRKAARNEIGIERRKVALQVDDDTCALAGIGFRHGLENPVGARRMIGSRHDRLAARGRDGIGDFPAVGRDDDVSGVGCHGTAPDVDDHGGARDIGERFARQAGRLHAGGNNDQIMVGHWLENHHSVTNCLATLAGAKWFVRLHERGELIYLCRWTRTSCIELSFRTYTCVTPSGQIRGL
ncbi:hypothetical protein HYPGJ_31404 [Hyphomicrobium sp. GJ21]|nr:hypothetical protein HYPGJ_31404 [Hyphomicrobium sp. GJ21]